MTSRTGRKQRRIVALAIALFFGGFALSVVDADPIDAQITPIDDEPGNEAPGLGNIVGSPEAGPAPEDAGDRGGWAQLALAGLLVVAVLFIASRILAEARRGRRRAAQSSEASSPDALSRKPL